MPALVDRVRLVVELAEPTEATRPLPRVSARLVGALFATTFVAGGLLFLSILGTPVVPAQRFAAIDAVVGMAKTLPSPVKPSADSAPSEGPRQLGAPVTMTTQGQVLRLTRYQAWPTDAVAAVSSTPFAVPLDATMLHQSNAMAWNAANGNIHILCLNGTRSSVLLAGRGSNETLMRLAMALGY